MSLRPQIYGFDLAKLRSLFGSGDKRIIAAAETEFERLASRNPGAVNSAFRATFRGALRQAIDEGVPLPGLTVEREPHVHLAMILAGYDQTLLPVDSDYWNYGGVMDAWENDRLFTDDENDAGTDADFFNSLGFSEFVDPDAPPPAPETPKKHVDALSYIVFGRRLFGAEFDVGSYYGYLALDEIAALRERLQEPEDAVDEGEDLAADLIRWCDELLSAKRDMWIFWA